MSSISLFFTGLFLGAAWIARVNGNVEQAFYFLVVCTLLGMCSTGIRMFGANR